MNEDIKSLQERLKQLKEENNNHDIREELKIKIREQEQIRKGNEWKEKFPFIKNFIAIKNNAKTKLPKIKFEVKDDIKGQNDLGIDFNEKEFLKTFEVEGLDDKKDKRKK